MPRPYADQQPYDPNQDDLYQDDSLSPLPSTSFSPPPILSPRLSSGGGMSDGMDMTTGDPTGGGSRGGTTWKDILGGILNGGSSGQGQGQPTTADNVRNAVKNVAPILGNAAKSRASAQDINDTATVRNRKVELEAPGMRIANAAKARLLSAGPSSASWGGPGSGLRGETVKYSGGASSGFTPADRSLMDELVHQQLQKALTGENLPQPGRSSATDKLLGGGATVASILGALWANKRQQVPPQPSDPMTPDP